MQKVLYQADEIMSGITAVDVTVKSSFIDTRVERRIRITRIIVTGDEIQSEWCCNICLLESI